jgi:hypothetical protein
MIDGSMLVLKDERGVTAEAAAGGVKTLGFF